MAQKKLIRSDALSKAAVYADAAGSKRIGKARRCVFHPAEKRCIGFIVKRPDVALMFHRKDLFVALDGFELIDGHVVVSQKSDATGAAACRRLGVSWEECVFWEGMPLVTAAGEAVGVVGDVTFSYPSGAIESVQVNNGATAHYLVGTLEVPAEMIVGFKRGIGADLATEDGRLEEDGQEAFKGGILVTDEVWSLSPEGGWAEAAGAFVAKASGKAREAADAMKPKARDAAKAARVVAGKGAGAVGKQVKASKGMFAAFKEEYEKALREE